MDTATFEYTIDQIRYERSLGEYLNYMAAHGNEISGV